jgi:hypothetical protein
VADFATQGRSETWKQNVLRNQAILRLRLPLGSGRDHVLRIGAVDPGVLLDQVRIIETNDSGRTARPYTTDASKRTNL